MYQLEYAPRAIDDLQRIKEYIAESFGKDVAAKKVKYIMSTVRQLQIYPKEGLKLGELLAVASDYRYLVIKQNYVIYRLERDTIKVVRILNEKQDFMRILFGISGTSDEGDAYWGE